MFQEEEYSKPVDMWSLGAVMSFHCNEQHLFTEWYSVTRWEGGQSTIDSGEYSFDLRQLVADLLSPNDIFRPTAQKVYQECMKNNRQRLDLPH